MTNTLKMADSIGYLAAASGKAFALQTLKSQAGYYFGTANDDGEPYTRESVQYWPPEEKAAAAWVRGLWTQRLDL